MRRLLGGSLVAAATLLLLGLFTGTAHAAVPHCYKTTALCAEPVDSIGYHGSYTGHDEPSLLFYSNTPGAGNSNMYSLQVPSDPKVMPNQAGTAGTWNFQLHPAFWLGMALCDNQSAPEFTHAPCVPNSDSNIFDGTNEAAPDYIGHHPGTAFLEVQFYPPGWVNWTDAISCDATKWCAAVAIFSFNSDQNAGVNNNADCLNTVGIEPANFAFITMSGAPHAPAGPLDQTLATFTPNPATDLFMDGGDQVNLSIHDSAAGLVVAIDDVTSGDTGSMTASVANGFAQVNFDPTASTCTQTPYAFHPMYSTSSEHTRVPWAAHSYNVAFADEIGHFEYCGHANVHGKCVNPADGDNNKKDVDDSSCFNPEDSLRIQVGGCIATDNDFDGVSYQKTWPGSITNAALDAAIHPASILFTSPTFGGGQNFARVGFEADLPRIEAADFGGICNRTTGAGCVNPPAGSNFYPFFTTRNDPSLGCVWQLGGANIPGTTNTFGGNSTAAFGPLLFLDYPAAGNVPSHRTNDFRNVLTSNPCAQA